MSRVFVIALLSATLLGCHATTKDVDMVKQQYGANNNQILKDQIKKELQASHIYQAYASYFQRADVALPGIQKFFAAASLEEREHAQMLIDYVNLRGGYVQMENIQLKEACEDVYTEDKAAGAESVLTSKNDAMCICGFVANRANDIKGTTCYSQPNDRSPWKNGLMAFTDALAIERFVNKYLLQLHADAETANDPHLAHMIEHHYLGEQVTSINQLAGFVTRLNSFGDNYRLGEYLFDQKL